MKSSTKIEQGKQIIVTLPKSRNIPFAAGIYQTKAKLIGKNKMFRNVYYYYYYY
jgi:hypothetical protein